MIKRLVIALMLVFAITASLQLNTISVVHGASEPLVGVFVYADPSNSTDDGSSYAITDASGQYGMTTGLIAGTYNITAFAYGYLTKEIDFVNVVAGQTTTGINFDLQASGGISGSITDAISGDPLNGTNLFAQLSNGTGTFGWFGTSGSDGSYLIATNLPTGHYNVSVFLPPTGHIGDMTTASVTAGLETNNVNIQLARSGILSGRVTAPNGTALFGISVVALSSGSSPYFGSDETDLSGNYRITTGLGTANYTVYASGAGNSTTYGGLFTPIPVLVTAGQEKSGINMNLTPVTTPPIPSGTISGRITDLNSNPIRLASVTADGNAGFGSSETDDNGYYSISSGLGTETNYNVSVTSSGYFDAFYPTLVSVTVGQTTPNINIQMSAKPAATFGTITGTVIGASNPIIPEFPNFMMGMLPLALATAIIIIVTLKTKRYENTSKLPSNTLANS